MNHPLIVKLIERPVVAVIIGFAFTMAITEFILERRKERELASIAKMWNTPATDPVIETEIATDGA